MLDRDTLTLYPGIRDGLRAFVLTPGLRGLTVDEDPDAMHAIAEALELPKLRIFETGGDRYEAERERWDDGNNVLAIAPGSSSPTSAMSTPTPACATPASRSSRPPAKSSGVAAEGHAACPTPSNATHCRRRPR
jgi:Arginine deiminase